MITFSSELGAVIWLKGGNGVITSLGGNVDVIIWLDDHIHLNI
jgi:hypothetical protein